MSAKCDICGKGPSTGFNVSHSHRKTKRRWLPNLRSMKVAHNGGVRRVKVCSSCLKANKVTKVV
ncbi:MAG TPA: 50S ribosomal protein L28 [Actinomycetota bacterium]|jgi:large subunit ribosomal protein L28|nr:50S ribosomal protein L28 [Actinomycetota bacterium]